MAQDRVELQGVGQQVNVIVIPPSDEIIDVEQIPDQPVYHVLEPANPTEYVP